MEHPNEQKTQDIKANFKQMIKGLISAFTPTKNKRNLGTDTMVHPNLQQVYQQVLWHITEPENQQELEEIIPTLSYLAKESKKLLKIEKNPDSLSN